ncbi:substrate-binding periplasmic protein [Roseibium salinum]|uniref:Transporter substrate-binding domain-containing protein n=1 Tax=Roseibium salinum TaxID=1604349 RepID=A0ABT3R768_9HYPH|nr:transporter substrate-binding domain-containing protein [Roseibium sp. DSM 29163]MCX2725130.1 transporter substrate-binding domain-containing protein [Roseibium sp. DSM 29163]
MLSRRSFLTTFGAGIPALALLPARAEAPSRLSLACVYYDDVAPYSYLDTTTNTVKGILPDLLDALAETGDYSLTHRAYPWARAQGMVATGTADAFCCPVTADRSAYVHFAPTPVLTLAHAQIFFAADNPNADAIRAATRIEHLYKFRTVDFVGNGTADRIWKRHPRRIQVSEISSILAMLASGHADFYFADPMVTRFKLRELGLLHRITSIPGAYVENARRNDMKFGLRKTFPDARAIVEKVDEDIRSRISPSLHADIVARYTTLATDCADAVSGKG